MEILNNSSYNLQFTAASDLTLKYILEKRAKYLPERVLSSIVEHSKKPRTEQPTLKELHNDTYQKLFEAKTLDEAKMYYPELSDVIDITNFSESRSKALVAIKEKMSLKDFTLQYIKDLYSLVTEENIVKKYGFSNRSILQWINKKLNITKPTGEYNILVKMTDEAENNRIGEMTRKQIKNNPELHRAYSKKGAETQKSPEAREQKRKFMVEFYKQNPEYAEKTKLISKRTWAKCTKIRKAFSEYTASQDAIIRKILEKRVKRQKELTPEENKMLSVYYKRFWQAHPEFAVLFKEARELAIKELTEEGLISKLSTK